MRVRVRYRVRPIPAAGNPLAHVPPLLFLDHFHRTSLMAEGGDHLVGFLIGFLSLSSPDEAYIHFLGASPLRTVQSW